MADLGQDASCIGKSANGSILAGRIARVRNFDDGSITWKVRYNCSSVGDTADGRLEGEW